MLELLLGFLVPIPATEANYTYSGYRWAPADAPIRLDVCEASAQVVRGIAQRSALSYGTSFRIAGPRTASAVRVRFIFTDTQWQPVETREELITGAFTPGSAIFRTHHTNNEFRAHGVPRHAAAVICTPTAITFSDGTSWQWTPPAAPYPAPAGAPTPSSMTAPVSEHPAPAASPSPSQAPAPARTPTPTRASAPASTPRPTNGKSTLDLD